MATAPTLTTLVTFDGTNGAVPNGPLTLDAAGDLYGTTYGTGSGTTGLGTVFELAAAATAITTRATLNATVGDRPETGVTLDANGNLIGTTSEGGSQNVGTVYEVAAGSMTATDQANFADGGPDPTGESPDGGTLITDPDGNYFGTAYAGGPNNTGGVFEAAAGTDALTGVAFLTTSAGNQPVGGVVQDSAGDLFGTTDFGGANNLGAVFEVAAGASTATALVPFSMATGGRSVSGLAIDAAGDLYGSTFQGGANGLGTVFEIAAGTSALTVLASFTDDSGYNSEGTLLIDAAGDLFGTASNGGANDDGTVFEVAASSGTVTPIVSFSGTADLGRFQGPLGGVVADSAGNLYGATQYLGTAGLGTLFEVSNSGFQVACFCTGTRLATEAGDMPVEILAIGGTVVTASGEHRRIKWLGHRSYAGRFLATNPNVQPIRFRAGSLGDGLPRRDLLVSPDHAMLLDGLLVPARCLVNSTTIVRNRVERVDYFHVELDTHDVLLAEGAASESFMDDDSRGVFHNAAEFAALYPDALRPDGFCARRVEQGPELEAIRRRLAEVAGEMAHAA